MGIIGISRGLVSQNDKRFTQNGLLVVWRNVYHLGGKR